MTLFNLKIFRELTDGGLCGSDFDLRERSVTINQDNIISISDLEEFRLPFSGILVDTYIIVTMVDGTKYAIKGKRAEELKESLAVEEYMVFAPSNDPEDQGGYKQVTNLLTRDRADSMVKSIKSGQIFRRISNDS
ncbi:hypothetical protein M1M30_gp161 [Maribacter phage Colly_1]|uniref:Uncharacterized protein n=1 Tax=Maribacter phage Colly_1 TaxID=2745691 RepID=A0A8E4XVN9_9CAUD|nr:hypothetical protein M1M30_gp161 [Maribacter phage Colly_1]QQO97264.1 hypothetical protein Colly1_161 [Maribacter phage Colly_1]